MKSAMILFLAVMLCAVLSPSLTAKPLEPTPETRVKINGESLPVYQTKALLPRHTEKPNYPREERRRGIDGQTVIYAIVNTDGHPTDLIVKSSQPSAAFGEAAKQAIKHWRFQILKKDGHPIRYVIQVPVDFHWELG